MRLSKFIRDNREQILSEWQSFARTLIPAAHALNIDVSPHRGRAMAHGHAAPDGPLSCC